MKPTVGRIVIFVVDEYISRQLGGNHNSTSLGLGVAPAIIVRAWTDTCVNLKVFGDGGSDVWVTSVSQDETEEPQSRTWHWPPRS